MNDKNKYFPISVICINLLLGAVSGFFISSFILAYILDDFTHYTYNHYDVIQKFTITYSLILLFILTYIFTNIGLYRHFSKKFTVGSHRIYTFKIILITVVPLIIPIIYILIPYLF